MNVQVQPTDDVQKCNDVMMTLSCVKLQLFQNEYFQYKINSERPEIDLYGNG